MISIDIEGSIPEHWFLGAQPMIKISEPQVFAFRAMITCRAFSAKL